MNKNHKFLLTIGVTFSVLMTAILNAPNASILKADIFSDVASSPYKDAISFMKTTGIVNGYSDGTFKPSSEITRAEFTKILIQTAFPEEIKDYKAKSCFNDVKTSDWFAPYVCLAKDKGVISGYSNNTFHPTQNINVTESLKISLEALKKNEIPDATGEWYQKYLNFAYNKGYMLGEWQETSKNITRGEMSQFIYQIKLPEAPAKNISINFQDSTITPFSVISIKGNNFDPLAATSVIFTTVQDGKTYVIPAVGVTSDTVQVSVPLTNYDTETKSFIGGNVSMKIVQIRTRGETFAINTSNEISNILIAEQLKPSIYKGAITKTMPKGAITASFILASIENLKSAAQNLPTNNTALQKSLTDAQNGLEDLFTSINKVVEYQGSPVTLKTNKGNTTINATDLEELDAIYLGYLGELENDNLIAFENNSWLIKTAQAAELSECVKRNIGGGLNDKDIEAMTAMACGIGIEPYEKAYKAGGELLPIGAAVTYGFPLAVSGMMFSAVAEALSLSKVAEVAIASGFSYLAQSVTESKGAVVDTATAIAKSLADHKLGGPFLESGLPVVKFLYEANKILNENKSASGQNQAIVADTDKPSQIKIIKAGETTPIIVSLKMPAPSQSKVVTKDSTQLVIPEIIPVAQPETNTTQDSTSTDNTGTGRSTQSQTQTTDTTKAGSMTLTSAKCIHKEGEDTYYNKGNYVQTTGTMHGPVGTHLEWGSGGVPEDCGVWDKTCTRKDGQPESSTWTFTQPANSDSWWYELILFEPDSVWGEYGRIKYGDVCQSSTPSDNAQLGGTVTSIQCSAPRRGDMFDAADFYTVTVSGTATGPVDAEVEFYSGIQCTEWSNCVRHDGEPATTSWTVTSSATVTWDNSWTYDGMFNNGNSDTIQVKSDSTRKNLLEPQTKVCP